MSGEIRAAEVMGLFQNMINKHILIFLNQTRSYDNAGEKQNVAPSTSMGLVLELIRSCDAFACQLHNTNLNPIIMNIKYKLWSSFQS